MPSRIYQEIDYSKLLSDLHSAPEADSHAEEKQSESTASAKNKRKKLLKDPEMRFVYSVRRRIIHDKDCHYVEKIHENDFRAMASFPENMATCHVCYRRALVRAGLSAEMIKDIDHYLQVLYHIGMSDEDLYTLTVQYGARFCGYGNKRIRIKLKDDTWEICKSGDKLVLLHNSYSVGEDYQRSFNGYFHLQMTCVDRNGFGYFFDCMTNYSWPAHVELLKAQAAAKAAELEKQKRKEILARTDNFRKFFRISLRYGYYVVLDCNDRLQSILEKNQVQARFLSSDTGNSVYSLKRVRIPRKQLKQFLLSMDNLKEYSLDQEFHKYAEKCAERLRDVRDMNWSISGGM